MFHQFYLFPYFSLHKLKEMGVMDKLIRKWLKVDVTCEVAASSPADIIDTASLFILLLIGLFFSLIFFAAEGIMKHTKKVTIFVFHSFHFSLLDAAFKS